MSGKRDVIHTIEDLQTGSDYLRYHIKMYVDTFHYLHEPNPSGWNMLWNAVEEDHFVQVRILINFLSDSNGRNRKDDVLAMDYFHDQTEKFNPLDDEFLLNVQKRIGEDLVHITTHPMPKLKSENIWSIDEISTHLVPFIVGFLNNVPENRLKAGVKSDCVEYLRSLSKTRGSDLFSPPEVSVHAST